MNVKSFLFITISFFVVVLSVASVSAADYNVNSLGDISGISSWLSTASSGDTLFFNLDPSDIITSLNNLVIDVSINIVSTTGAVIQGNSGVDLFRVTANNVNISGLTINGFNQAITVDWGNQTTIQNNTFNNNDGSVAVYNSNRSTVANNTIKNNGGNNGIGLGNFNYTKVDNNTIENSGGTGVATWDSHDNEITNNKINRVSNGEGIYVRGDNHTISNNEIEGAENGIYVDGEWSGQRSSNVKVLNNKVSKNRHHGIFAQNVNNSIIKNNTANYNDNNGIGLAYSNDTQIINNTCNFNGNISYMGGSPGHTQKNGIFVSNSANPTISGNNLEGNLRSGVGLNYNYGILDIFNNMMGYNNENGIFLYYTQTNSAVLINNNTIYYNNHSGIASLNNAVNITNNIIYNNNLSGIYVYKNYYYWGGGVDQIVNILDNFISNNYEGITLAASNISVLRNTLINNTIGLKLNNFNHQHVDSSWAQSANVTNNTFEYNRIVNSTINFKMENLTSTQWVWDPELGYSVETNITGDIANNSGNFNWWGLNDPEDSIFQDSGIFNATYWFVTNLTSLQDSVDEGVPALFNYTIGLNDPSVSADSMDLPYFNFTVEGNYYDARISQTLSKIYTEAGDKVFGFFVDNQWLEAGVTIIEIPLPGPEPGPNPEPEPGPTPGPEPGPNPGPEPTPAPTPTPTPNNNTNNTSGLDALKASAGMKGTGIHLIAVLLALIGIVGFVFSKKQ